MESRGPLFGGGGAFRFTGGATDDARGAALGEAATVAEWAAHVTPEWVRALGGVAERFSDRKLGDTSKGEPLWGRFDEVLSRMLGTSKHPEQDLEVVLRQAAERRFRKTVDRARRIAGQLGTDVGRGGGS